MLLLTVSSTNLVFADIETDQSVYSTGELIQVSGTLLLQDGGEQVNIVEIQITDSNGSTIVNAYTPVDNDNTFSSSYETGGWEAGDYTIAINYNDTDESTDFELVSSSSSNDESNNNSSDTNDESNNNSSDTNDESNQQESSSATLSDTVPASPINLTSDVISPTEIDLSWSLSDANDSSITGFQIEERINTDPNYSVIVENTGNTDTAYSIEDLTPETVYAYRVSAINSAGESEPSSSTTVKTSTSINPGDVDIEDSDIPTNVVAKVISPTSIELSWNPPTQTYDQTIQSYTIQEEIASDTYNEIANTGSTNYTVSNLITDESYTFTIVANYLFGSSDVSETATATPSSSDSIDDNNSNDDDNNSNDDDNNSNDDDNNSNSVVTPSNIPDPPVDLKVNPVLSTQIDLSWSAPENDSDDNNSITGYKIEVRTINDSSYSMVIEDTESTETTYSHTGLNPDTSYIYRVYAINEIGTSDPSSENLANTLITDPETSDTETSDTETSDTETSDTLTTSTSGAATPNPPVNLQATQISQNRINLSWSAPTDSGESPLIGYKIESKTSDESDYAVLVTNTGSTSITTYSHTGLTAGLTYDYRISAINSAGESNPSDVITATIEMTGSTAGGNEQEGNLSQQPQAADPLQPVQVTLSTDKSSYGPSDSITISGTTDSSSQTIPLGMRVVSPDGAIVYVRSISIDSDGSFETVIPSTQRQSSTWESDGEYTVEVTQNGRIQATAAFANDSSSSLTPGADDLTDPTTTPADDLTDPTTTPADQQQSPPIASPPVPGVNPPGSETSPLSGDDLETLKAQNTALESTNQQLQDENNELQTQIDDLNSQLEQLDLIVKEQMRVMLETLGIS